MYAIAERLLCAISGGRLGDHYIEIVPGMGDHDYPMRWCRLCEAWR